MEADHRQTLEAKKVSRGSSSQEFGGDDRTMQRSSALVRAFMVDSVQSVRWNTGGVK